MGGSWLLVGLESEMDEGLRWEGDIRVEIGLMTTACIAKSWTTTESVRVIDMHETKYSPAPKRNQDAMTLSPFFSYRRISQSFWTGASHYSSNPEGVATVIPHFRRVLTGVFLLRSSIGLLTGFERKFFDCFARLQNAATRIAR
ncbi:uncharacterized protein LACBIDRAFT_299289 [Laccaria bicolor S238N-H82]|uniref:Predicted protein n=1 Tax=Laccaria bicolor (strain S238N-H82 / ATCC MYA-4686) TaxID=486041 RepID=B0DEF4_LACBS|nr:uncharacterized protein LACBIDRAFT_299289 [Laccaria bicolor S238N-H82]EDR07024.1 predicted protein [Laccaria bicolor S238N-H82]|eukprot:XP_001882397.1 predicted protein [Laccaria bicolor S238N-H82]